MNLAFLGQVRSLRAPIRLVQSVTGTGATLVLNNVVAGNTLICTDSYFRTPSNGIAASTPTDSNGTLSIASADVPATFTGGAVDDIGVGIWVEGNAAAGTHTVTPQALSSHFGTLAEYSGLTASPFDVAKSAVTNNGSQTSQVTGTTAATAQAQELVVIGLCLAAASGVTNVGLTDPVSGFTTLQVQLNDSTGLAGMHAFKIISATGTQSATFNWTDSEANQGSHGAIATFKDA